MAANPLTDGATRKQIAEILGVDERSITNYQAESPPIPTARQGRAVRYPIAPAVAWYLDRERRRARENKLPSELEMARQRKVLAEARIAEKEAADAEGSIIPLEVHEVRVAALAGRLAAACTGGLMRFRGDIQLARTPLEAQQLLERMGDELFRACQGVGEAIESEAEAAIADAGLFGPAPGAPPRPE